MAGPTVSGKATYRYVNANVETAKRAAAALDTYNAESRESVAAQELVH
jgi:hypothetical protein